MVPAVGQKGFLPVFQCLMVSFIVGFSGFLWNGWHQLLSHAERLTQWIISFCAEICVNLEKQALLSVCNGGCELSTGERGEGAFAQTIAISHVETSWLPGRVATGSWETRPDVPRGCRRASSCFLASCRDARNLLWPWDCSWLP